MAFQIIRALHLNQFHLFDVLHGEDYRFQAHQQQQGSRNYQQHQLTGSNGSLEMNDCSERFTLDLDLYQSQTHAQQDQQQLGLLGEHPSPVDMRNNGPLNSLNNNNLMNGSNSTHNNSSNNNDSLRLHQTHHNINPSMDYECYLRAVPKNARLDEQLHLVSGILLTSPPHGPELGAEFGQRERLAQLSRQLSAILFRQLSATGPGLTYAQFTHYLNELLALR